MQLKARYTILVIITVICWGSAYPVVKHLVTEGLPPFLVSYLRLLVSLLAATALLLAGGERPHLAELKSNFGPLLAMALTGGVLFYGFMALGMQYTQAGKSTLINSMNPAIIVLLAHFILKEPLGWRRIAGVIVSLGGVVLSVAGGRSFDIRAMQFVAGDLMFVGTALCWSTYTIVSRIYGRRISYRATLFWMFLLACLAALPFAVPTFGQLSQLTLSQWLWLLYLGVFPGGICFYIWNRGLVVIGTATCGMINSLLPVSAIVISILWLGEGLSWLQILGGALVILGVWQGIQKGNAVEKVES